MKAFISTLPGVFEAIEGSDEVRDAFVFAAWRHIAGEQVSERTLPVSVDGRQLIVAVADKTWKRNLESLAPQLLFKLNAALARSLVDRIEFRVLPGELVSREGVATEPVEDAVFLPKELSASAGGIRDDELRERVLKAAEACLSRKHTFSYLNSDTVN